MEWMEVAVHTTTQGSDVVSALLMELGSTGTEILDRADIPDPGAPGPTGRCTMKSFWRTCRRT